MKKQNYYISVDGSWFKVVDGCLARILDRRAIEFSEVKRLKRKPKQLFGKNSHIIDLREGTFT